MARAWCVLSIAVRALLFGSASAIVELHDIGMKSLKYGSSFGRVVHRSVVRMLSLFDMRKRHIVSANADQHTGEILSQGFETKDGVHFLVEYLVIKQRVVSFMRMRLDVLDKFIE